ncbi:MAG: hypothetical protein P8X88_06475, partial [Gammaproteobacteria bacterium]
MTFQSLSVQIIYHEWMQGLAIYHLDRKQQPNYKVLLERYLDRALYLFDFIQYLFQDLHKFDPQN